MGNNWTLSSVFDSINSGIGGIASSVGAVYNAKANLELLRAQNNAAVSGMSAPASVYVAPPTLSAAPARSSAPASDGLLLLGALLFGVFLLTRGK